MRLSISESTFMLLNIYTGFISTLCIHIPDFSMNQKLYVIKERRFCLFYFYDIEKQGFLVDGTVICIGSPGSN